MPAPLNHCLVMIAVATAVAVARADLAGAHRAAPQPSIGSSADVLRHYCSVSTSEASTAAHACCGVCGGGGSMRAARSRP
eukprot:gene10146-biopygen7739